MDKKFQLVLFQLYQKATKSMKEKENSDTNTGGGAHISGNVNTGGGNFIGRDFVQGGPIHIYETLDPVEVRQQRQLRNLLRKMRTHWIENYLKKSLHNRSLISLEKLPMETMVSSEWQRHSRRAHLASQSTQIDNSIYAIFKAENRTLLILGEPGSGKTTVLLELAEALIECAEADKDLAEPVPVILNLASWSKENLSLEKWVVNTLKVQYQIPEDETNLWLAEHRLLLLLDGLDEVKADRQNKCVEAINLFIEQYAINGIVVSSRTKNYSKLAVQLKLNAAVCIQPMSNEQVDMFLSAYSSKLLVLQEALKNDDELYSIARTPLILNVMCITYENASSEDLQQLKDGDKENRRKILFNDYVNRMLGENEKQKYQRQKTLQWLALLAKLLQKQGKTQFDPSIWHTSIPSGVRLLVAISNMCCLAVFLPTLALAGALGFLSLLSRYITTLIEIAKSFSLFPRLLDKSEDVALFFIELFGNIYCGGYILQLWLVQKDRRPWNFKEFLDYATEHDLLYKMGDSYIFFHQLLLEHFAAQIAE